MHGRSSTQLAAVQYHLLAVQNHLRWFRTNRARLQQLARQPTTLFLYIDLHGHSLAQLATFQNHWLAVQIHFRWFGTKRARLHKLARRPTSPRKCHLAACDPLFYICLQGRSSALQAAVLNNLLAVQNHLRWFRTNRARLQQLARRPTTLFLYIGLHGRSLAQVAAVQNHWLAVQNHFRWFRTNRARLQQLVKRPTTLFLYIGLHCRSLAQVAAVQNHWLAVKNHFQWFRNKRARLHKLAKRPTSPRKCHLAAFDLLSYICLRGRSYTLLAAVQNHLQWF